MPVRINQYDQRTRPQGPAQPYLRPVDTGEGIAPGLAAVGQSLGHAAQTLMAREEDDARVFTSSAMAEARARANELRRTAFAEAPDGWRGATDRVAQEWAGLRQETLGRAPTRSAQRFLTEAMDAFQPLLLEDVAGDEQTARRAWRVDMVNRDIDTLSGVVNADPAQYDASLAHQLELVGGLQDIDANQRRGLEDRAREQLSVSAVAGLVERDPHGALRALRDPEAGGAYANLTGPQRDAFAYRAQAEINRREAEARAAQAQALASLRDTVSAHTQLFNRGIMPSQTLDVGMLARALGPDVAQAYIANMAGVAASNAMAAMPSAQVAQVAAGAPNAEAGDIENLLTVEARTAAARVLEQRRTDPGGYALQTNQMRHPDLLSQIQNARGLPQWDQVVNSLRERGADAVELRRRGVTQSIAPLSNDEARALASWLRPMTADNRLAFLSQAARGMSPESYQAMMRQIAPNSAVLGYAGSRFPFNPTVARRLVQGEELLSTTDAEGNQRRPIVDLPAEAAMQRTWTAGIGQAYERIPNQEAAGYAAYRAYYAARAYEDHDTVPQAGSEGIVNTDRAREALGAATGGIINWSGRMTLMRPGQSQRDFTVAVGRAFERSVLAGRNPADYQLSAIGNGRYIVEGVRDPASGDPLTITLPVR